MKTSAAGIAFIEEFEGCDLVARLDTLARPPVWTIGHGETGPYVVEGMHYTRQQAADGLARRLAAEFEPGVMAAIGGAPVTQAQFDAMVSLAWNIGVGGFAKSSVARLHRAGDYAGAADAFLKWNRAGGKLLEPLVRRREAERALYLSSGVGHDSPPESHDSDIDRELLGDLLRAVQRVVGTDADGIFGPKTAAAITAAQAGAE